MMGAYRLNCEITGVRQTISGREHALVRKPGGFEFYLDEAFLFVLRNICDEEQKAGTAEKLGLGKDAESQIKDILVRGGFVRDSE